MLGDPPSQRVAHIMQPRVLSRPSQGTISYTPLSPVVEGIPSVPALAVSFAPREGTSGASAAGSVSVGGGGGGSGSRKDDETDVDEEEERANIRTLLHDSQHLLGRIPHNQKSVDRLVSTLQEGEETMRAAVSSPSTPLVPPLALSPAEQVAASAFRDARQRFEEAMRMLEEAEHLQLAAMNSARGSGAGDEQGGGLPRRHRPDIDPSRFSTARSFGGGSTLVRRLVGGREASGGGGQGGEPEHKHRKRALSLLDLAKLAAERGHFAGHRKGRDLARMGSVMPVESSTSDDENRDYHDMPTGNLKEGPVTVEAVSAMVSKATSTNTSYHDAKAIMEWQVWQACKNAGAQRLDFFEDVLIANDGGLSEVGELWYGFRWISTIIVLVLLCSNLGVIFINDISHIGEAHWTFAKANKTVAPVPVTPSTGWAAPSTGWLYYYNDTDPLAVNEANTMEAQVSGRHHFLMSRWMLETFVNLILAPFAMRACFGNSGVSVICFLELLLLSLLIGKAVLSMVFILSAKSSKVRWFNVTSLFWTTVPELCTFTAMRLLHFVTPAIIAADIYKFYVYSNTRWNSNSFKHKSFLVARKWLKLIVTRVICFSLGLDAFLVKVYEARSHIDDYDLRPWDFLNIVLLIVQVLGIVQLQIFVRSRIFMFIFGGEDSIMQAHERALQNVWMAVLAKTIWQEYSWPKALAIMLTFDDTDFQKLVLNERTAARDEPPPMSPTKTAAATSSEAAPGRSESSDSEDHSTDGSATSSDVDQEPKRP